MVSKKISHICIGILVIVSCFILLFMGVFAIKKAMDIRVSIPVHPIVRCEIQLKKSNELTFTSIFSNVSNTPVLVNGLALDTSTNTLVFSDTFLGVIGANFTLKILNYTDKMIVVESQGDGVAKSSVTLDAYDNEIYDTTNNELNISTLTSNFNLKFNPVHSNLITTNLTNCCLDESYANTVVGSNNEYYLPIGQNNIIMKFIPFSNFIAPTMSSLTINGDSQTIASYYSNQILTIPFDDFDGPISTTLASFGDAYTVTYDSMGGTACASETKNFGSTYGTLPTPTRTGYAFDGWTTKNLFDLGTASNYTPSENITYFSGSHNITNGYLNISLGNTSCGNGGFLMYNYYFPFNIGETFTLSSTWSYYARYIIRVFDASFNNITSSCTEPSTLSGDGYNDCYLGWYSSNIPQLTFAFTNSEIKYFTIGFVILDSGRGHSVSITNIQLEKNTTKTAYQAYSAKTTSASIVNTASNHTLYATWKKT